MKIFRWKFIVPTAIVIALVCGFFIFYLDIYLKKAFISAGELIFGAKVEVGSLKTKFKGLSVNVRDIKIGDKDNEFKNLADIDRVNFGVRFIPLLSMKFIIDDMTVDGIKWGTARETSCKLPPKKQKEAKPDEESFASKAVKEMKEKAVEEYNAFPSVRKFGTIQNQIKNFSPQSIIDMSGIQSVKEVQDSYVDLMGKYDSYNKKVNEFDVKSQIDGIAELADAISKTNLKTAADIQTLKDNLSKLSEERKNLEQTYADLKAVKDGLIKDAKEQQNAFKDISSLINKDVDSIASKLSVPSLDFKNITRMLFGDIWIQRTDKVLYYMSLIKKYMPEKKAEEENKPEPRERMKGREINYPVKNKLPKLWIANVKLSGTSGGEGKEGIPITFSGIAKNIASDQKLTGQKTTFEAKGDDTNQILTLSGSFDRVNDIAEDIISFTMEGMDAVRLGIPESDYTPSFEEAKAKIYAEFMMLGSDFITKAGIYIDGLQYDPESKDFQGVGPDLIKYVSMLWQGINSMNIEASMSIKDGDIKADFMSDIDKLLAQRFNNIINAAVGDVKVKIRKEVTQYVDSQKSVLQAEADKYNKQVQKELEPKLNDLQKKINEIKKVIADKENELKKSAASTISSILPIKK
ncbi:MAG: TIGR03545 family protein [Endomicrobia bacterium]|nr:TIGR03545 family protein [Endomicrobiia bacterium]